MKTPVAISTVLGERMRPDDPAYTKFFEALREEGRRTQPVEELTAESLAPFGALLIGAPGLPFLNFGGSWHALHAWIARGGALLRIFDPVRLGSEAEFLESFCPGVRGTAAEWGFPEMLGHNTSQDESATSGSWLPIVHVDVGTLLGRAATMTLVAGQPLYAGHRELAEDLSSHPDAARVLVESLPVPEGAFVAMIRRHAKREGWVQISDDNLSIPSGGEGGGHVFLHLRVGRGTVTAFAAARSFDNENLGRADNLLFLQWLLRRWLPRHATLEVASRMARPQRHRMLNAYPMAPLTPPITDANRAEMEALETAPLAATKGLIVGVLPHPFCNPAVRGCGFCTFPHEGFSHTQAHAVSSRVVAEIDAFRARAPGLVGSAVEALYLGGGTANLTPADDLVALSDALRRGFTLAGAEVTLEGVPVYYTARDSAVLGAFERAFPECAPRISMGVQTFDAAQLARMGRRAFGDRALIERTVREAHARGMTTSVDLLFNLPEQTVAQMLSDVDIAVDMGVDHLCLYHLVLFEGLGTEWSHDRSLLAALPDNGAACDHWRALRGRLLERGFVQTSLTNFERVGGPRGARPFRYEPCAYDPERYDILGFGPSALSMRMSPQRGVKLVNADGAAAYTHAVDGGSPRARGFLYGPRDTRVAWLTRKVVTLGFERADYDRLFGTDAVTDFAMDFEVLADAGLLTLDPERVLLTERGMFFADTIAGMLATRQVHDRRLRDRLALGRPAPPEAIPFEIAGVGAFMG